MNLPITLDFIQTVAFAGVVLFLGYGIRRLVPPLSRVNIPAPVCGGLPLAGIFAVAHAFGYQPITFDTALQVPLQNAFFASIGFAASLALLRRGGPRRRRDRFASGHIVVGYDLRGLDTSKLRLTPNGRRRAGGRGRGVLRLVEARRRAARTVGLGLWVSGWLTRAGWTLPAYIGAMLVAAIVRNLDDVTGMFRLSQRVIDDLGNISLSLFLVMALMTLRLWELAGLVIPLLTILAVQVALIAVICVAAIPRLMGRDYDAAVMAGGFCGFMLGTSANAMANMGALVERYGPAPKAYLVRRGNVVESAFGTSPSVESLAPFRGDDARRSAAT